MLFKSSSCSSRLSLPARVRDEDYLVIIYNALVSLSFLLVHIDLACLHPLPLVSCYTAYFSPTHHIPLHFPLASLTSRSRTMSILLPPLAAHLCVTQSRISYICSRYILHALLYNCFTRCDIRAWPLMSLTFQNIGNTLFSYTISYSHSSRACVPVPLLVATLSSRTSYASSNGISRRSDSSKSPAGPASTASLWFSVEPGTYQGIISYSYCS